MSFIALDDGILLLSSTIGVDGDSFVHSDDDGENSPIVEREF